MGQKQYRFFSHTECEFFPCHSGADPEHFNCLFCYCPLYCLGPGCGGQFAYTAKGVKDCTRCLLPHSPEGYDHIQALFPEIVKRMRSFQT